MSNIIVLIAFIVLCVLLAFTEYKCLYFNKRKMERKLKLYSNFTEMLYELSGNIIIETEIDSLNEKLKNC